MIEKRASEIMEKTIINGTPHPNTLEYLEALDISIDILGTDYTRDQLKNWILINKYPFLLPKYWNRKTMQYEIDEDYKYNFTLLDAMPNGWKNAFGEMMCEEIHNALVECGGLDDYMILDIKEKHGMLRWVDAPFYEEVSRITDKYSTLSENICMFCGKPDVPITGTYWTYPICKDCYCTPNNYVKGDMTDEELKQFHDEHESDWNIWNKEYNKMSNSYTVKSWSKEYGEKTIRYDISRTANKIRAKWRTEHGKN